MVQSRIRRQPELEEGYRRLFKGFAFWANIPWLIMGALVLLGHVDSSIELLAPAKDNFYRLVWFGSSAGLFLLLLYWVYFMKGAETLEKYPGLPFVPHWDARKLRYFFLGLTLWNIAWFAFHALGFEKLPDGFWFIAFPILFIGMWIGIGYLFAAIVGWNVLAKHYLAKTDFQGELFRFKSGRIGIAGYGNCLVLGTSPLGFYLATSWMFRIGHPALLIPWEDISVIVKNRWLFSRVEFEFSKTPGITLNLSKRLAEKIANESAGRLNIS